MIINVEKIIDESKEVLMSFNNSNEELQLYGNLETSESVDGNIKSIITKYSSFDGNHIMSSIKILINENKEEDLKNLIKEAVNNQDYLLAAKLKEELNTYAKS